MYIFLKVMQSVRKIEHSLTRTVLIVKTEELPRDLSSDTVFICDNISYICEEVIIPEGGMDYVGLVVNDTPYTKPKILK